MPKSAEPLEERVLGASTVLFGDKGGKYPSGNSILVRGPNGTVLIDPSLGIVPRKADLVPLVDQVINSHCHEDHVAGNFLFPDASVHLHEADIPGIQSLDAFMALFGYSEATLAVWRGAAVEQFHFTPRPDAKPFTDGAVFDLGGGVRVNVVHAPGHTRGHCALHVEPDDVLYLADIDLSSFGPYYGDAWSDLEDFERTLEKVRAIEARHYATFHHIGVLDERDAYLERLDRFTDKIRDREDRMLEFLAEPHDLDDIVRHRFVYRQGDPIPFADDVERRSMSQHLDRLERDGRVRQVEPGRYLAKGA